MSTPSTEVSTPNVSSPKPKIYKKRCRHQMSVAKKFFFFYKCRHPIQKCRHQMSVTKNQNFEGRGVDTKCQYPKIKILKEEVSTPNVSTQNTRILKKISVDTMKQCVDTQREDFLKRRVVWYNTKSFLTTTKSRKSL